MSNVTLAIGGRSFTLACADGEEAHLTRLGGLIDEKVAEGGATGQTEGRMLLYAALLLADNLVDLRGREDALAPSPGLAARLGAIAGRLENLADQLESQLASA